MKRTILGSQTRCFWERPRQYSKRGHGLLETIYLAGLLKSLLPVLVVSICMLFLLIIIAILTFIIVVSLVIVVFLVFQ